MSLAVALLSHTSRSAEKYLELKSTYPTTNIDSFSFNDESCLITLFNISLEESDIKNKSLPYLQFYQLIISTTSLMDLPTITDQNDYQTCVTNAATIPVQDKPIFCPNFYYVFYAELEINLNRYFSVDSREQWSLLFVDYNFMPPIHLINNHINRYTPFQVFRYQPDILTILHNAKVKYRCRHCHCEWATARGRAIFQAEVPEPNKHNVLFGYLFTQKCRMCHHDGEPSWYLDEVTRVMKNICRILIQNFYPDRQFLLSSSSSSSSPSSPSLSSSSEDGYIQRGSYMRRHHYRDLCPACQEGSCFGSHEQYNN